MILFIDTGIAFGMTKNVSDAGYVCMETLPYGKYGRLVGQGYDNVVVGTTQYGLRSLLSRADQVVFCDNGIKLPVGDGWIAPGRKEICELDKLKALKVMRDIGFDTVPSEHVVGLSGLFGILEAWGFRGVVKIDSFYRGLVESTVITSMDDAVSFIKKLGNVFGSYAFMMDFRVDEWIEYDAEWGIDAFVENGKVKRPWFLGVENGKGYLSLVTDSAMKDFIKVLEKEVLEGYNCVVSIEFLVSGDSAYLSDINFRWGHPFSLIFPVVIENWEEFLLNWNEGSIPSVKGRFIGGRIEEGKPWERLPLVDNFVPRRSVRIISENKEYHIPLEGDPVIGVTAGYGNTLGEVVKMIGGDTAWADDLLDCWGNFIDIPRD